MPESECSIPRARYDLCAVWTHGKIQDAVGMTCERRYQFKGGISPDGDVISRSTGSMTMRRNEFLRSSRPEEVAYLGKTISKYTMRCDGIRVPGFRYPARGAFSR